MASRSTVKILMSDKALELMKERLNNHPNKYAKELMAKPDYYTEETNSNLIGWSYVKWCSYYEDVSAVLSVLNELDQIVEKDPDKLDDYYYKMIEICEDNATYETTNDYDDEYTSDFYVTCEFSI